MEWLPAVRDQCVPGTGNLYKPMIGWHCLQLFVPIERLPADGYQCAPWTGNPHKSMTGWHCLQPSVYMQLPHWLVILGKEKNVCGWMQSLHIQRHTFLTPDNYSRGNPMCTAADHASLPSTRTGPLSMADRIRFPNWIAEQKVFLFEINIKKKAKIANSVVGQTQFLSTLLPQSKIIRQPF